MTDWDWIMARRDRLVAERKKREAEEAASKAREVVEAEEAAERQAVQDKSDRRASVRAREVGQVAPPMTAQPEPKCSREIYPGQSFRGRCILPRGHPGACRQGRLERWTELPWRLVEDHLIPVVVVFWIAGAAVCEATSGTSVVPSIIFGAFYGIPLAFAAAFAWLAVVAVIAIVWAIVGPIVKGIRDLFRSSRRAQGEG